MGTEVEVVLIMQGEAYVDTTTTRESAPNLASQKLADLLADPEEDLLADPEEDLLTVTEVDVVLIMQGEAYVDTTTTRESAPNLASQKLVTEVEGVPIMQGEAYVDITTTRESAPNLALLSDKKKHS